jgi:hypothetical protein
MSAHFGRVSSARGGRVGACRLLLALVMVGFAAPGRTLAQPVRRAVTVRVYDSAGVSMTILEGGLSEAGRLLATALVDVQWLQCGSLSRTSLCRRSVGEGELLLRLVSGGPSCTDPTAKLGNAVIMPARGGVLATAYPDCVAAWARATRVDGTVLLGRVVAHELGHLMLHTTGHPRHGLMRPRWTLFEVRRNRAVDWSFTAADAAAMRPQPER